MFDVLPVILQRLLPSDARVALVALLLFGLVSYVISRAQVYHLDQQYGEPDEKTEEYYMRLPVAWPTIFVVWASAVLAFIWVYPFVPTPWAIPLQQEVLADPGKQLFLIYLVGFASMWAVYLLSGSSNRLLKSRSLRRLLMAYSGNWSNKDTAPPPAWAELIERDVPSEREVIAAHQRKANSSITWIALLIAAAAVVLGLINDVALQRANDMSVWEATMLATAAGSAIIAFYCFVVSADALETVFNDFSASLPTCKSG